tara:strand:+ start:299 stop:568 length:270 start_codon:yes stop_codon:yes gene_type:complete
MGVKDKKMNKKEMSNHYKEIGEGKYLLYGHDPVIGYFYEIWDSTQDENAPIDEGDEVIQANTREDILEVLERYDARPDHIYSVFYDLPF